MPTFHISDSAKKFEPELAYTLRLWAINQSQPIRFSSDAESAITVGASPSDTLQIAEAFTSPGTAAAREPFVLLPDGRVDHLASAFQMINSLQEYGSTEVDELQRFRYTASYQHRMSNAGDNLVQQCFDAISRAADVPVNSKPTRFFLSHDIDLINSAIIEDGYNVIRRGRFDLFLKMLFHVAMGRPDWLNMDKIMALESAHDCKSIFFWIVNKGRINRRETNADYHLHSPVVKKQFDNVAANGFENGIHKSLSNDSFREEFIKYGHVPYANRYHYLKFTVPAAWQDLDAAGLKLDASMGFSAEIGFRNSYGLPFNPFNLTARTPFGFVEAPLHIMDRTFFQYKKQSPEQARTSILRFFEKNRSNCVLSVLWHNNFFTDYKFRGYLALYKQILAYIRDNRFGTISAREITQQYAITP